MKKTIILIGLCGLIFLGGFYVKRQFYDHDIRLHNESIEALGHIKLDSIFPIDDISKVTVTNFYGTHILTDNQLKGFKTQLKGAHSRGSLQVKPGHISIELELKDATIVNAYGYTGQINFDGGFENGFSLSFDLPDINLNYDNYR